MKKLFFLILLTYQTINAMPVDTSVFSYMPLKVGNSWTWQRNQSFSPGPGREKIQLYSSQIINNKLLYKAKWDVYYSYSGIHNVYYLSYWIDSSNGNLYKFDTLGSSQCLSDSMNSKKGDSAFVTCGNGWYRADTGNYSIFNQSSKSKIFNFSNYFEVNGYRIYAKNIGKVYEHGQAMMSSTEFILKGCIINGVLYGDTTLVGINQITSEIPNNFSLSQNYPNPFNPSTNIKFQIVKSSNAKLVIYDAVGKEVVTLVDKKLEAGEYEANFEGTNLPSGVYYYKLAANPSDRLERADGYTETKKMVLIK